MHPYTEQNISEAKEAARTGDADKLSSLISAIALSNVAVGVSLGPFAVHEEMIIDEDGNTLLHIATMHGHIPCIRAVQLCYSKSHGRLTERMRRFAMRPNKTERNTALHLAARHENLDMLRAVYRMFCCGWLPGEESFGREPEEDATDRLDEEEFGPPLIFLRTQNAAGRDAAAEARAAGREANARWCEEVMLRLDPAGKYRTREAMRKLTEYVYHLLGINT